MAVPRFSSARYDSSGYGIDGACRLFAKVPLRVVALIALLGILLNTYFHESSYQESKIISTNHQLQDETTTAEIPGNLSIAFIGDSLARYHYLSLVHYLRTGTWARDGSTFMTMKPSSSAPLWNHFYNFTASFLSPFEECDCYRQWNGTFNWNKHVENRYYSDDTKKNYVSFFTKFGPKPFHGHWDPSSVFRRRHSSFSARQRPFLWSYYEWPKMVEAHLARLQPKPEYVVFNQGHWGKHGLDDPTVVKDFVSMLKRHGMIGIYRTTTARKDGVTDSQAHDTAVCLQMPHCLNVSWTNELEKTEENYIDQVHFHAHVNNRMARQLMELIKDIE